jgi:hypothetical protein
MGVIFAWLPFRDARGEVCLDSFRLLVRGNTGFLEAAIRAVEADNFVVGSEAVRVIGAEVDVT